MKKLLLFILLSFPLVLFCQNEKKVLIIGVDGCRPDALQIANTPNIDALIANGIFAPDALNDDITISGPGWSAILCGVWSDKHGVVDNSFNGSNYEQYPSFYKYLNDFDASLDIASICHWSPINNTIIQNDADFKLNVSSEESVALEAINYLNQNPTDVMFLHFDNGDYAGHAHGFSPQVPEYMAAIEGIDGYIGMVMQAIENRPTYTNEDWLVLITTDHGGLGTSHGGSSIQEENVFLIASGNNIEQQLLEKETITVVDSVSNCLNDTVALFFDGFNDYVQIPSNPLFDFGTAQDFTIECRVKTNTASDVAIIGNKDWNSGGNKGFVFSFAYPSGPSWKVNIGDGSNRADINTGGAIADNEWHTLSVSFDRDGLMTMYQDGQMLDATNISNVGDISTNEGLFFGADINGTFPYLGNIAEVRVWNTVLSEQNISDWHCTSIDSEHPNFEQLIGYWKMNEAAENNTVTDYSSNDNHGNIVDANWINPNVTLSYDYSTSGRLTDIVPTALQHLCIPSENAWQLDGNSLIENSDTLRALNATNISATNATLSWLGSSLNYFIVRYRSVGENDWIETTTNDHSITLSNLLPNTAYEYEIEAQVRDWCSNDVITNIETANFLTIGVLVQIDVLLEGAFNPINNLMNTYLRANNLLPLSQPYDNAPWNYNGNEGFASLNDIPTNAVDWILVEVYEAETNTLVQRKAGILLNTGRIAAGNNQLNGIIIDSLEMSVNYHFVVRHRNHIDIMSSEAQNLPFQPYSFLTNDTQAKGNQQLKNLGNGYFAMIAGDIDANQTVTVNDINVLLESLNTNAYQNSDCNLDGNLDYGDILLYYFNSSHVGFLLE